ncbi:HAMP domain-containing sensor histidine kinase [Lentilactobacillus hilgardii]|uniref:HAMP domain-containing sensor histidine kinase n=1 Tax=Lentilactobacillus hilgardii TaxID=1588 RepID=UPI003FA5A79D
MKLFLGKQKQRNVSIAGYLGTLVAFVFFATLPVFLYGEHMKNIENSYLKWYVLYWILVAAIFIAIVSYQKHISFDVPVERLSKAAKKVAKGNFSVYLKPIHSPENYSEIDDLFENFNTMVAELGSTETLKNDFVANVSHEFKAPLAVIKSYANVLQSNPDNLDSEVSSQYIQTIIDETDQMASLVTNILKLNKIENQVIQPTFTTYDLSRQLTDSVLKFESVWETSGIILDVDISDGLQAYADAQMMDIVWQNLLSNAFKFTPAGKSVSIKAQRVTDGIEVSVIDTGEGMSKETIKRAFDKFYQGDTSHSQKGNGLGLAIANRIVSLMDGTISVESEQGTGSRFMVWLPDNDKLTDE